MKDREHLEPTLGSAEKVVQALYRNLEYDGKQLSFRKGFDPTVIETISLSENDANWFISQLEKEKMQ